jgi:exodeoxyribonuclease VII small subunit
MAKKKSDQTIESLISRLEAISAKIQDGDIGLEESIELYEEGQKIAAECNDRLTAAQKKLEVINPNLLPRQDKVDPQDDDEDDDGGKDNRILFA